MGWTWQGAPAQSGALEMMCVMPRTRWPLRLVRRTIWAVLRLVGGVGWMWQVTHCSCRVSMTVPTSVLAEE